MIAALLIVFGFLELLVRFVITVAMVCTIIGMIFMLELSDNGYDVLEPKLWKILEQRGCNS